MRKPKHQNKKDSGDIIVPKIASKFSNRKVQVSGEAKIPSHPQQSVQHQETLL